MLRNLRPVAQPHKGTPRLSKKCRQFIEGGFASRALLVNGFVPEEPTTVPLGEQQTLCFGSRPEPVAVANDLDAHAAHYTSLNNRVLAYGRTNKQRHLPLHISVVWCPKYRRPVITGPVDPRLKEIIRQVCAESDAPIVELETMPDHVHRLVTCDPQFGNHRIAK